MGSIMIGHAKRINELHEEVFGAVKMTLDKAIQIGKLLTDCKAKIPHGDWMPWMEKNLKFSQMTATRYIAVFNDSRRLDGKSNTMLDLTKVYQSLIEHKPKPKPEPEEENEIENKLPFSEEQEVCGLENARPEENIVDVDEDEGDVVVEENIILKQLKKYWAVIDSHDKQLFIDWLKSRKEI